MRCSRLGLRCEPAPQKQQKLAEFSLPSSSGSSSGATPVFTTESGCIAPRNNDASGHIWQTAQSLHQPDLESFCLRHMAAIARRRNAYDLMERVIATCRRKGLDLNSILTSPTADDDGDDPGASTHPFEILSVLSASRGYCQARTVSGSGNNTFFNNAAFENDVLSLEVRFLALLFFFPLA